MMVRARYNKLFGLLLALPAFTCGAVRADNLSDGITSYNAGKYSQALTQLEASVKTNPYDATAHYYLGLCYQSLKQTTLARQHFSWVAANARDARLKSYAEKAVAACGGARASGSSTAAAAVTATAAASASVGQDGDAERVKRLGKCKVLMFETSWCHYCHEFAPEFDAAANKYRGVMDFQHVDAEADENLSLKEKYGIKSYPRLVYLDGHGNLLYNEGRGAFSERLKELTGK